MKDWFAPLPPMPDPAAHEAFRARVQEILTIRCQAQGSLAALQARLMEHPNRPIPANEAMAMKRFEKALADATQLARMTAETYHGPLAEADAMTWQRAIAAAETAISLAVTKMQLRHAVFDGAGPPDEAANAAMGCAVILLAWALCDLPVALRIVRAGEEAREAAAR